MHAHRRFYHTYRTMTDTTDLKVHGDGAPSGSLVSFDRKQINLLKRTICKGATDEELSMFVQQCKRYGLDPFTGQIHAVKRWDSSERREVLSVQVGIDGFRLIADRTGKWRGVVGPMWCGPDGSWREVWLQDEPPAAAKVGVLRSDFEEVRWGIARWSDYVQTKKSGDPTYMWANMGPHMLGKCAEALALRSAFPNDLSGLYTDAEMAQAGGEVQDVQQLQDAHEVATRHEGDEHVGDEPTGDSGGRMSDDEAHEKGRMLKRYVLAKPGAWQDRLAEGEKKVSGWAGRPENIALDYLGEAEDIAAERMSALDACRAELERAFEETPEGERLRAGMARSQYAAAAKDWPDVWQGYAAEAYQQHLKELAEKHGFEDTVDAREAKGKDAAPKSGRRLSPSAQRAYDEREYDIGQF